MTYLPVILSLIVLFSLCVLWALVNNSVRFIRVKFILWSLNRNVDRLAKRVKGNYRD